MNGTSSGKYQGRRNASPMATACKNKVADKRSIGASKRTKPVVADTTGLLVKEENTQKGT